MDEKNESKEDNISRFDETDLKNLIYQEIIKIVEPLEHKGKYRGNSHHLTQEICGKLSPAIMEKVEMGYTGKIKWKFKKEA